MWVTVKIVFLGLIAVINSAAIIKRFNDHDSCDLDYFEKSECGYQGISENECLANGCCYQETHLANVPWCYIAYGNEPTEPQTYPYEIHSTPTYPYDSTYEPYEEEFGLNTEELSEYDMAWVPESRGNVPDHAVYVIDDEGTKYYIVRVEHDGVFYPGKLGSRHDNAHFAVEGEGELKSNMYEVLQQLPTSSLRLTWIKPAWTGPEMWIPDHILRNYAVAGGEASSDYGMQPLIVAIGKTPEGYHPGYIGARDRYATIPWGGSALQVQYDVTPTPETIPDVSFAVLIAIPEEVLPSIKPPSPDVMQAALVEP